MTGAVSAARDARWLGLAIGVSVGPAGGFVQAWSGIADGRWHVWLLMTALGALVGAASLPLFMPARGGAAADHPAPREPFGRLFLTLFGFSVGVVAGTFAAFPVGASMGAVGGAAGGLAAALVWRSARLEGTRARVPLTTLVATVVALLVVFVWSR
ncbi:MAG: hypothetical protein IT385_19235 [Deltaproteobacteria bacterium]|nr:hypothetical protein [Deltaproteobacteria bacterium]